MIKSRDAVKNHVVEFMQMNVYRFADGTTIQLELTAKRQHASLVELLDLVQSRNALVGQFLLDDGFFLD
jgi:hypothetical protein